MGTACTPCSAVALHAPVLAPSRWLTASPVTCTRVHCSWLSRTSRVVQTKVFFCPYGLCRALRHLSRRDELHAVVFQAWRSMITQVICRPCGLYTSLRHPIWIACGSLSGSARQELDTGYKSLDVLFVDRMCEFSHLVASISVDILPMSRHTVGVRAPSAEPQTASPIDGK